MDDLSGYANRPFAFVMRYFRQRLAAQHLADLETARRELRDLADTLELKVAERTRDLAAASVPEGWWHLATNLR